MPARSILAAILLLLAACAARVDRTELPSAHPFFHGLRPPLVIAHRGGADLRPENTVVAFQHAAALGADVLELDLHATVDGELVVIHDATVDRTTDGTGAVRALPLRDVQALDAGYRWSANGGRTFPYRGRGVTVPTLAEVLTALPDARLLVEIKPRADEIALRLCRLLDDRGAAERVMVASMQTPVVEAFRRACPHVATGATPKEVALFASARALRLVSLPRVAALAFQIPERWYAVPVFTPRVLDAAHDSGLQVHVWTIDDPADMRRLVAMGVDGIVTDRPDVLLTVLGRAPAPALVRAGDPW